MSAAMPIVKETAAACKPPPMSCASEPFIRDWMEVRNPTMSAANKGPVSWLFRIHVPSSVVNGWSRRWWPINDDRLTTDATGVG